MACFQNALESRTLEACPLQVSLDTFVSVSSMYYRHVLPTFSLLIKNKTTSTNEKEINKEKNLFALKLHNNILSKLVLNSDIFFVRSKEIWPTLSIVLVCLPRFSMANHQ